MDIEVTTEDKLADSDGTKISSRFWNSSRKVDILEDGGR